MRNLRWVITASAAMLAACAPVPRPGGIDSTPPTITLTVLRGRGTPTFSSAGTPSSEVTPCAKVPSFPTPLSVSATDDGGVRSLSVSVFPGRISDVSAAPQSAETNVTHDAARNTDVLTVTPHPPAGSVQPNLLVTFSVSEFSAIVGGAQDVSGNLARLDQVDVRPLDDPAICSP